MKSLRELLLEQRTVGHFSMEIKLDVRGFNDLVGGSNPDTIDDVVLAEIDDGRAYLSDCEITQIAGVENECVRLVVKARLADINGDDLNDAPIDDPDDDDTDDNPDDDPTGGAPAPRCTCGAIVADDQRRDHLTSHGLTAATMTDAQIDACFAA